MRVSKWLTLAIIGLACAFAGAAAAQEKSAVPPTPAVPAGLEHGVCLVCHREGLVTGIAVVIAPLLLLAMVRLLPPAWATRGVSRNWLRPRAT